MTSVAELGAGVLTTGGGADDDGSPVSPPVANGAIGVPSTMDTFWFFSPSVTTTCRSSVPSAPSKWKVCGPAFIGSAWPSSFETRGCPSTVTLTSTRSTPAPLFRGHHHGRQRLLDLGQPVCAVGLYDRRTPSGCADAKLVASLDELVVVPESLSLRGCVETRGLVVSESRGCDERRGQEEAEQQARLHGWLVRVRGTLACTGGRRANRSCTAGCSSACWVRRPSPMEQDGAGTAGRPLPRADRSWAVQ
jgi:hypothetical protein